MTTSVTIQDNRDLRRLEALHDGKHVAGFAQYEIGVDGTVFDFFHTEVTERFEGQGIGGQLAAGVVEFARNEGIKIRPTCSFLRSYVDKHEDTKDVVAEQA
jgi:predicted GNAT family acetyltransferase